jgi:putative ABC transport system permease protein
MCYPVDGVNTSVFPRKHANVAQQGSNELISVLGVGLVYGLLCVLQPVVEDHFGLYSLLKPLSGVEYGYALATLVAGCVIGLVPAFKPYRNTLADGLSMRL